MMLMHMNWFRTPVAAIVCIIFVSSLVLIPFANASAGNPTPTPTLLWSYKAGEQAYLSPVVVGSIVYVGLGDNVYALNAANGAYI